MEKISTCMRFLVTGGAKNAKEFSLSIDDVKTLLITRPFIKMYILMHIKSNVIEKVNIYMK
jgi:hypothetical protein